MILSGNESILCARKEVRPFLERRLRIQSRLPQVRGQVPVRLFQSIEESLHSQSHNAIFIHMEQETHCKKLSGLSFLE